MKNVLDQIKPGHPQRDGHKGGDFWLYRLLIVCGACRCEALLLPNCCGGDWPGLVAMGGWFVCPQSWWRLFVQEEKLIDFPQPSQFDTFQPLFFVPHKQRWWSIIILLLVVSLGIGFCQFTPFHYTRTHTTRRRRRFLWISGGRRMDKSRLGGKCQHEFM